MHFVREAEVAQKYVLVRADFNVTLNDQGRIIDDFRIRATLPTIEYLIANKAKIILMAHLGKPGGQVIEKLRLGAVRDALEINLGLCVVRANDCVGPAARRQVDQLPPGGVLLLENLRFYKEEEDNNSAFARDLASLGELYINDAFGACHRAHASIEAITKFLPSYGGFLLQKEIENLSRARDNPDHPLTVVIGGAKMSTKIKLIQNFLGKAENIILGGALANTVLHAKGIAVGRSVIEEAVIPEIKKLELTDTKLHLPVDAILCPNKKNPNNCHLGPIGLTQSDEAILDIGLDTEALFSKIIKNSAMIIWNGPMGLFELEPYAHGSLAVARAITESSAFSIVGGGETVTFLEKYDLADKFSFVSTGGGAMMEFLAGEKLPGLEALK